MTLENLVRDYWSYLVSTHIIRRIISRLHFPGCGTFFVVEEFAVTNLTKISYGPYQQVPEATENRRSDGALLMTDHLLLDQVL